MKKLLLAVFFVFFIPSLLFADDVDKGLPSDTPSRIKESARLAIQSGIDTDAVIKMTQTMLAKSFSEQQIITSHELIIKAKKQNISEEPIINKLHEGVAKNVGAENILQAMEKVRSRYELANTYAQTMKTDTEQSRIITKQMAECMAAGMDKNSITRIMGILQQKTRNIGKSEAFDLNERALATARTMARSGVASNDIVDVMSSAFNRNYNAGEMEKLGNTFMTQAKGSASASELARAYSYAIKNGATPESIGSFNPGPGGTFAAGGPPPPGGANPAPPGTPGGALPPPSGGVSAASTGTSGGAVPPPPDGTPSKTVGTQK